MDDTPAVSKKKGMGFFKFLIMAIVFLALGAGVSAYVVTMKPEMLGLSKGQAGAQAEVDALVMEIGKLLALPTDEKPTVATITDVEKLKEQAFFKNAANGDKVLIYTNAKKAILYRPVEKKVLEVGAVNIRQQEAVSSPLPEPLPVLPTPVTNP